MTSIPETILVTSVEEIVLLSIGLVQAGRPLACTVTSRGGCPCAPGGERRKLIAAPHALGLNAWLNRRTHQLCFG